MGPPRFSHHHYQIAHFLVVSLMGEVQHCEARVAPAELRIDWGQDTAMMLSLSSLEFVGPGTKGRSCSLSAHVIISFLFYHHMGLILAVVTLTI